MKLKTLALICTVASMTAGFAAHAQDATPRQRGGGGFRGMEGLTQEEKQKVTTARETANKDPKVQAAQEKMRAANKEYIEALDAAMLAADPSLEPILKKMQAAREQRRGGAPGAAPAGTTEAPKPPQ